MNRIQQQTEQHNLFSKEVRLFSKGKTNSLGDRFVPPREMPTERPTPPRGRFTAPRENDAGGFKECSSKNIAFSQKGKFTPPKGRFFPLREKIADNFTSLREKAREGHVPPVMHVLLGGGPNSPRYKMMSPRDKFPSPRDTMRNKPVFFFFFQGRGFQRWKGL